MAALRGRPWWWFLWREKQGHQAAPEQVIAPHQAQYPAAFCPASKGYRTLSWHLLLNAVWATALHRRKTGWRHSTKAEFKKSSQWNNRKSKVVGYLLIQKIDQIVVLVSKGRMSTVGRFSASNHRQSMENLSALSHISYMH